VKQEYEYEAYGFAHVQVVAEIAQKVRHYSIITSSEDRDIPEGMCTLCQHKRRTYGRCGHPYLGIFGFLFTLSGSAQPLLTLPGDTVPV
jgi:hypothetical protein